MARCDLVTAVSLDQFAQIMGIHPATFNGLTGPGATAFGQSATERWWAYDWQMQDILGRYSVAQALALAEESINEQLGYKSRPEFILNERRDVPQLWERADAFASPPLRGERQALSVEWGHIQKGGLEATTVIGENQAITYSDVDGDGINDHWTITVASSLTDTREIGVYFTGADRLGQARDESWRIRPVQISATGTAVTLYGSRWLMVKPVLYERLAPRETHTDYIDLTNADNFVTHVDVVRRYANDSVPHVTIGYTQNERRPATLEYTGFITRAEHNAIHPYYASRSGTAWQINALPQEDDPDYVIYSYYAGMPTDAHGNVDHNLAQVIARYAVGFLARDMGGDTPFSRGFNFWREDLARMERALPYYAEEFRNPFGTWRGALEAWRYVKSKKELYKRG